MALLGAIDIERVVALFEHNLITAMQMEAESRSQPTTSDGSWWRTTIEETGEDSPPSGTTKNTLLRALRDSLEKWVRDDFRGAGGVVERYLGEDHIVLRRLGLHILNLTPERYPHLVARELGNVDNLDDTRIHHEFFLLLQSGFPHLGRRDQRGLLDSIQHGPPAQRREEYVDAARSIPNKDPQEIAQHWIHLWIRDRLSMLRAYLPDRVGQAFGQLVKQYGEPDRPELLTKSSGFFSILDVSPLSVEQIGDMSPDDLLKFLKIWQPEPDQDFGPERVSIRGMAQVVAQVVVGSPEKYAANMARVALLRAGICPGFGGTPRFPDRRKRRVATRSCALSGASRQRGSAHRHVA